MLLIDGVKYELWTPPSEDTFEQMVKEHTQEIFGEQSIYLDRKQKLKSLSGIGSIPDGYAIIFDGSPQWHIVEMELSSHPLHEHIVSQVSKFITGISNPNIQRTIVNILDETIGGDDFLRLKLRKAIEPKETHRFLSDLISRPPVLSIIIEKDTEELREALSTLNHPQIKVIEFQTFKRVDAEAVHAHLFQPIYEGKPATSLPTPPRPVHEDGWRKRVTIKDLIDDNRIKVGQVIYRSYKGQKFEGTVNDDGRIELRHTREKFDAPSGAAKSIAGSVDGWTWWYTTRSNGEECLLDDLRKEYRII